MKKISYLVCLLGVIGFIVFQWPGPAGLLLAKEEAKAEAPRKKIAVIPIQKAVPHPLYLSIRPGLLQSLRRAFRDKDFKIRSQVDYDPRFVPETLGEYVTQRLLGSGFLVFTPNQVAPYFETLALNQKELPVESLRDYIDANAFLLITLTEWDSDQFDRNGKVKVGFEAMLVDADEKRVVWSNRGSKVGLETPSDDFLHSKYQRDVLRDLARIILKGFPKGDWAVA